MDTKHNANRAIFESWPIPRALTELALPMIFGQLIVLVYNLADTFFIGRTNNPLMVAGVSLLLPVFNISITFANLFGIGGYPVSWGRNATMKPGMSRRSASG